jgi:hypothetical protein
MRYQLTRHLASQLGEVAPVPLGQIRRIIEVVGADTAQALADAAVTIAADAGFMVNVRGSGYLHSGFGACYTAPRTSLFSFPRDARPPAVDGHMHKTRVFCICRDVVH